jgi:hypothetical protein
MVVDSNTFTRNVSNFPFEELMKYGGQWVAWNADGTAILFGSDQSDAAVMDLVRRAGIDPLECVIDYIQRPDEVIITRFWFW